MHYHNADACPFCDGIKPSEWQKVEELYGLVSSKDYLHHRIKLDYDRVPLSLKYDIDVIFNSEVPIITFVLKAECSVCGFRTEETFEHEAAYMIEGIKDERRGEEST